MIDLPDLRAPRRRYWLDALIIGCLAVGLAFILLWQTMFVLIPAGSVGVLYRLFLNGTDTGHHLREGLAFKLPWNIIYLYDARVQSREFSTTALSLSGLSIDVDVTILFVLNVDHVGDLHRRVGPEYYERKLLPNAIEAVREVVGQYDPHDLYTVSTEAKSSQMLAKARAKMDDPAIQIIDIVVRKLTLPNELNEAITNKLTQEQIAQAYEFRLQVEQQEAERKRIEAIGIQTFYSIVSNSLTPALLTWRGIEATVQVAKSPNSKVVIVGGGKDQLPLILGSDIANVPPSPPTAPIAPGSQPGLPDVDDLPSLFPKEGPDPLQPPQTSP